MSDKMNEGDVAELVARTLQWAVDQVTAVPAIADIVGLDIGEVTFATVDGGRFRLIVERDEEAEAHA